jgi:cell cycle arrest protein BUB3
MADGRGYANTSIEGRVAVEFFDESPQVQEQLFVFKCHRIRGENGGNDTVTPVNSVSWHPRNTTFATAGSDNHVVLWDAKAKKRVKQFTRLPFSAMAIDIDPTGQLLAVGASDDSFKGTPDTLAKHPIQSAVFVRDLSDVSQ